MALPAHLLDRLPLELRKNSLLRTADSLERAPEARFPLDALLGELLGQGGIVELAQKGGRALGTSLALRACAEAQKESLAFSREPSLCGFVDTEGSLYAPGVLGHEVRLDRLLVARPRPEALAKTALRMAEARIFSVLVIDIVGSLKEPLELYQNSWIRLVRRLALTLEGSNTLIILLTDSSTRAAVPLPTHERLELSRVGSREILARRTRSRRGVLGASLRLALPSPRGEELLAS